VEHPAGMPGQPLAYLRMLSHSCHGSKIGFRNGRFTRLLTNDGFAFGFVGDQTRSIPDRLTTMMHSPLVTLYAIGK
jgi:hypothetical protein